MRELSASRMAVNGTVLLGLAFGLSGCLSTATYGTGESPELSIIKGVTGSFTGVGKEKKKVEYKPRAPLVMPPAANLPEPVRTAAADPDWPTEPGARGEQVEDPLGNTSRSDPDYVRKLKPLVGALPENERPASYDPERASDRAHLEGLRNPDARKKFKAALADADGTNRTDRRYLTDPPAVYRQPAETAPKEFDDIDENPSGSFMSKLFRWRNRNN